jgi:hypothetical protein
MSTTISTCTSNRIAAGVTAAYLRDLSRHERRRRATAAAQRSAATASPPPASATGGPRVRTDRRLTPGPAGPSTMTPSIDATARRS